jgi:hypothetical protein
VDAEAVTKALMPLLADSSVRRHEATEVLTRVGGADRILNRIIREQFAAERPELLVDIAGTLLQLGDTLAGLQAIIQILTPRPWAAVVACEKLVTGQALLPADGHALFSIVGPQRADTEPQRRGRQYVLDWLWSTQEGSDEQAGQLDPLF